MSLRVVKEDEVECAGTVPDPLPETEYEGPDARPQLRRVHHLVRLHAQAVHPCHQSNTHGLSRIQAAVRRAADVVRAVEAL